MSGTTWQREGDPGRDGVLAQLGEGGDTGAAAVPGDAVLGQERGDAAGGQADGGFVDAEDLAEQPVGHAQPQVADGGGHAESQQFAAGVRVAIHVIWLRLGGGDSVLAVERRVLVLGGLLRRRRLGLGVGRLGQLEQLERRWLGRLRLSE